jgi:hypothetical protein
MEEHSPEQLPEEQVEKEDNVLLKPKKTRKPVEITEEERKIRSERMKKVNQARIEKAKELIAVKLSIMEQKQAEKLEKIKQKKESIGIKTPKTETTTISPQVVEKKEKSKKKITIVNQADTDDEDSSEEEIVIVNKKPKSKPKEPVPPQKPIKPEVMCRFV